MTRIVELTASNQFLLDRVAEGVFDNRILPDQLSAFLGCPRHIMAIAICEGLVVGMTSAVEYFHPDKRPQLWINEAAVAPTFRNHGIGRQLIEFIVDVGRKRGCISAWLGTDVTNLPGQRCFAKVPSGKTPTQFLLYEWDTEAQVATQE